MAKIGVLVSLALLSIAVCVLGYPTVKQSGELSSSGHTLWKRFINPSLSYGGYLDAGLQKMRTRRGTEEECEKLQLCKLHARSRSNFLASFQLYFVSKENAKLWDHHARSLRACEQQYGDCHER